MTAMSPIFHSVSLLAIFICLCLTHEGIYAVNPASNIVSKRSGLGVYYFCCCYIAVTMAGRFNIYSQLVISAIRIVNKC